MTINNCKNFNLALSDLESDNLDGRIVVQVRRSTICAICSEDTGNYHLNYGASACYSCRAFFRRAIQKDRNPQFICKRGQSKEHDDSMN